MLRRVLGSAALTGVLVLAASKPVASQAIHPSTAQTPVPAVTSVVDDGAVWSTAVPGLESPIGKVAVVGSTLVADVPGSSLTGIDLHTGAVRWRDSVGGDLDTPAVVGDRVWYEGYEAGPSNELWELDSRTGALILRQHCPSYCNPRADGDGGLLVEGDDPVQDLSPDGTLRPLPASEATPAEALVGQLVHIDTSRGDEVNVLSQEGDTVVAASETSAYLLSLRRRTLFAQIALSGNRFAILAAGGGVLAYLDGGQGEGAPREFAGFSLRDGHRIWTLPSSPIEFAVDYAVVDGTLIGYGPSVQDQDEETVAVDLGTGRVRWRVSGCWPDEPDPTRPGVFLVNCGAGQTDRGIRAVVARTGEPVWTTALSGTVTSHGVLAQTGNTLVLLPERSASADPLAVPAGADLAEASGSLIAVGNLAARPTRSPDTRN